MASTGLLSEAQLMQKEEPGRGDPHGPLDLLKIIPFEADAASDRLGWVGLEATRYRAAPASEIHAPATTHKSAARGPSRSRDGGIAALRC
jgi:hypothetical protein